MNPTKPKSLEAFADAKRVSVHVENAEIARSNRTLFLMGRFTNRNFTLRNRVPANSCPFTFDAWSNRACSNTAMV